MTDIRVGPDDAGPWPSPSRAWAVVALLNLAYVVSFIDRTIISLLVEPIKADLGLSDTQLALLQGAAFGLFYTAAGLPLGWMIDRYNRKLIVGLGCTAWCLMTAACGLATGFWQLFLARLGVGLGEATLSPGAASLIADLFPPERRARAMSVYMMGGSLGVGLALIVGGSVIGWVARFGTLGGLTLWQTVFVVVGLAGLVIALPLLLMPEPPRRETLMRDEVGRPTLAETLAFLTARRAALMLHFSAFALFSIVAYAMLSWTPSFFVRTFGWTAQEVGLRYGLVFLIFGACGALAGGVLAGWLRRLGMIDANLRAAAVGVIGLVPFAVAAPLVANPWVSLALFGLVAFFFALPSAGSIAAVQEATPNEFRGQVSALYYLAIGASGLLIGPLVVAGLTDGIFGEQGIGASLALASALLGPVAAVLILSALPAYREILLPQANG